MSTHSTTDTLVRMANDIGKFFRAQGEERAVPGIANHVKLFWEPRMKKQIFEHLEHGGAGLDPLTLAALEKLKADMHGMPTAAEAKAAAEALARTAPVPQPSQQPKAQARANGAGSGKGGARGR